MGKLFLSPSMDNQMFPKDCAVSKATLSPDKALEFINLYKEAGAYFVSGNFDEATIEAFKSNCIDHGINNEVPVEVNLSSGDSLMMYDKVNGMFSYWNVM